MAQDFVDEVRELAELRIVEIGHSLAGRLLVKLLCDQGASASCLDWLSAHSPAQELPHWNDGMPALALDLNQLSAQDQFRALIGEADLLIDGLPAGSLARLGLQTERLRMEHPRLIDVRFSAYPAEAGRAEEALEDKLIAAELGLNYAGHVFGQPPGPNDVPVVEPLAIPSTYGAMFGATYVAAALMQRDRLGHGFSIEVPLFNAGIMALNAALAWIEDPKLRNERSFPSYRLPILDRYRCADGRFFQLQGNTASTLVCTLRGLGHPEWFPEAVKGLAYLESEAEVKMWRERFASVLRTRSALEWEGVIAAARGAGTLCRTRSEWVGEAQSRETGIVVSAPDAPSKLRLGPAVQVFAPKGATGSKDALAPPSPAKTSSQRPLAGLRVLDLTVILAGPTIGRLLGELGAEVIKVDVGPRAVWPGVAPMIWLDTNRAKRSALIDLKTEGGREALWRLIEQADVFVENFREGRIAALGFGYEQINARNPRIVYLSANAFDFGGPFSDRPGWEPNAQAMTGMQAARSGPEEMRYLASPINDYGTAVLGTFGVLLGLRSACRSGQGRRITVSLARTASFFQVRELTWYEEVRDHDEMTRVAFPRCVDGWVLVPDADDEKVIDLLVAGATRAQAIELLRARSIKAAIVRTPRELTELGWLSEAGLLTSWQHHEWGSVRHATAHACASQIEQRGDSAAPQPGEHTREVLSEAGFSETEIAAFYDSGAVTGPLSLWGA